MHILPNPQRTLAIPLAALALGAAGGTSAALIIAEGETIVVYGSSRAAEVRDVPRSTAAPVPERVTPSPAVSRSSASPAPVPERVSPAPAVSRSSASASPAPVPERVSPQPAAAKPTPSQSPSPVPERISGARTR